MRSVSIKCLCRWNTKIILVFVVGTNCCLAPHPQQPFHSAASEEDRQPGRDQVQFGFSSLMTVSIRGWPGGASAKDVFILSSMATQLKVKVCAIWSSATWMFSNDARCYFEASRDSIMIPLQCLAGREGCSIVLLIQLCHTHWMSGTHLTTPSYPFTHRNMSGSRKLVQKRRRTVSPQTHGCLKLAFQTRTDFLEEDVPAAFWTIKPVQELLWS